MQNLHPHYGGSGFFGVVNSCYGKGAVLHALDVFMTVLALATASSHPRSSMHSLTGTATKAESLFHHTTFLVQAQFF